MSAFFRHGRSSSTICSLLDININANSSLAGNSATQYCSLPKQLSPATSGPSGPGLRLPHRCFAENPSGERGEIENFALQHTSAENLSIRSVKNRLPTH